MRSRQRFHLHSNIAMKVLFIVTSIYATSRPSTEVSAFALTYKIAKHAPFHSSSLPRSMSVMDGDILAAAPTVNQEYRSSSFDSFNYSQWYPVIWSKDVPINQPIRVTLFDVDYVLAKTIQSVAGSEDGKGALDEEILYAMVDRCPHKQVALSEGRITDCGSDDKKYIQCSYHGWSFDGGSGQCVEIPQNVIAKNKNKQSNPSTESSDQVTTTPSKSRREDAIPVAVQAVQGMVWIQPSYTPLEALAAMEKGTLLPPPRIPEIDMEGYKTTLTIRDFPIDWTVLIENIMDPDHGLFAHSSSNTGKGFDLYGADGVDNPVHVKEEFTAGGGWKITSSVNAVQKLLKYNKNIRSVINKQDELCDKGDAESKRIATSTFVAPSLIYQGRRDNFTAPSPFLTGFWICPTGTGKSRFMSAAIGKAPFSVPRWIIHLYLNTFLDQDTYLLLGQHKAVLTKEAEGYLEMNEDGNHKRPNNVRKSTYVYRSPTESLPVKLGQYFDATLARAPNRKQGVLNWYNRFAMQGPWSPREVVLDRYEQHTKICPDSMDVVKRCDKIIKKSKLVGLALLFLKIISKSREAAPPGAQFILGSSALGVLGRSFSFICNLANRMNSILLGNKIFYSVLAIAFASFSIASRVKREFFFVFDEEKHRKAVKSIANNWADL